MVLAMQLSTAIEIGDRIKARLSPYCDRIEIAGSIRRRKPEVGDIEIVAIPRIVACGCDLFGEPTFNRDPGFAVEVVGCGRPMKGDPRVAKYIRFETRSIDEPIIKVDLFTATLNNWGLILAIRTGSADFSHRVLACGWVRCGYHSVNGMLTKNGVPVPVREERDLFEMAGVEWREPQARI
jgi:DNA polymerase/3'-5' exonuclease PolX